MQTRQEKTRQLQKLIKGKFHTADALALIRQGACPNTTDGSGNSLIHLLIKVMLKGINKSRYHKHLKELLTLHLANPDIQNHQGLTPLQYLIASPRWYLDVAMELVDAGADYEVPVKSHFGKTLFEVMVTSHSQSHSGNDYFNAYISRLVQHYQRDNKSLPENIPRPVFFHEMRMPSLKLGSGNYGTVCLSRWNNKRVAVKVNADIVTYDNEKSALLFLTKEQYRLQNHMNIIQLYGWLPTQQRLNALVLEYMPKGDLSSYYNQMKGKIDLRQKFEFAHDVAIGLSFVHYYQYLHRDIKMCNMLLSYNLHVYLSDFGFAVKENELSQFRLKQPGTLYYAAPELFNKKPLYSQKSDVYAYAITFFEIVTGKSILAALRETDFPENIIVGERPRIGRKYPLFFSKICQKAWHQNPQERPSANSIRRELKDFLNEMDKVHYGFSPK